VNEHQDLAAAGRAIVDSNLYMTLATSDENGRPWASPVYYAHEGYTQFVWVSSPDAAHSRNIAARPEVGIVIFDSRAPIGTGVGVYVSAVAEQLTGDELERGIEVFSRRSQEHGGSAWSSEDVVGDARLRLYRAMASERWILGPGDERIAVSL
jgi:pyridoxine/pyridoxamine 5'-phosphate oxidase